MSTVKVLGGGSVLLAVIWILLRLMRSRKSRVDVRDRLVLITGASSGLGEGKDILPLIFRFIYFLILKEIIIIFLDFYFNVHPLK